MSSCHGLTKTNEGFKLSDSDLVGRSSCMLLCLSSSLVLILEDSSRFFGELRFDCTTEFDVVLEFSHAEIRI